MAEEDKFILSNININPNALLLLDDCADEYGRMMKLMMSVFSEHHTHNLTVIMTTNIDSAIDPSIRRQPEYTIYCHPDTAISAYNYDLLSLSEDTRRRFKEAANQVESRKRCLVYDRFDDFEKGRIYMTEPKMLTDPTKKW